MAPTPIKKLPQECPSCSAKLAVTKLVCPKCATEVDGVFAIPTLASFTQEEQQFILDFVRTSGSLKQMAGILQLSYPTVRNYLDALIDKVNALEHPKSK